MKNFLLAEVQADVVIERHTQIDHDDEKKQHNDCNEQKVMDCDNMPRPVIAP